MLIPSYKLEQLTEIAHNFEKELIEAEHGAQNSIAFIHNPLPSDPIVKDGELYQAISIGGSHLECSQVKRKNGKIDLLSHKSLDLPLLESKEILFSFIKDNIDPDIKYIGLNFAYPIQPFMRDGLLDGKLIKGTKQHTLTDLIGLPVGAELEKYIKAWRNQEVRVSVANDTVCVVLSGLASDKRENIAGGIVGTGLNFSLFMDDHTIVNLESGNFDNFPQTETGKAVDHESVNPGYQLFEKEVSGGYLYYHYDFVMRQHHQDVLPLSSTSQLNQLAESDEGVKSIVARHLLQRSASLIAAQMAGIYWFKKKAALTFIMEGSLYWVGWQYKETVTKVLQELGISPDQIKVVRVDKSNIVGAAGLV
jgi:hexokinase